MSALVFKLAYAAQGASSFCQAGTRSWNRCNVQLHYSSARLVASEAMVDFDAARTVSLATQLLEVR
jgi:hypothetical protein